MKISLPARSSTTASRKYVKRKKMPGVEDESVTPDVTRAISQPDASNLSPQVVRSLQRTHGNQFVQRLVASSGSRTVQRKASISQKASPGIQRLAYTDSPTTWGNDLTVTRSGEGVEGVYFIKKGGSTLVVKPLYDPGNVDFGNALMESMGFEAPKMISYAKTSTEGAAIAQLLLANKNVGREIDISGKKVNQVENQVDHAQYFSVMSKVEGKSIQTLNDDEAHDFLTDPGAMSNVGRMMVGDAYAGHGDRFFGKVNLGNFFYQADPRHGPGKVATIDNDSQFSNEIQFGRSGSIKGQLEAKAFLIGQLFDKQKRMGYVQQFLAGLKQNVSAGNKAKSLQVMNDDTSIGLIKSFISLGIDDGFRDIAAKFQGDMDIVRTTLKGINKKYGDNSRDVDSAKALGLFVAALVGGTAYDTAIQQLTTYIKYRQKRASKWSGFKWTAKLFNSRGF